MAGEKRKNAKLKAVFYCLIFSVVLMIFPVTSGAIAVINDIDTVQSYWLQGFFMMLSALVPVSFMWLTRMKPAQIGFNRLTKGSGKTVLYF